MFEYVHKYAISEGRAPESMDEVYAFAKQDGIDLPPELRVLDIGLTADGVHMVFGRAPGVGPIKLGLVDNKGLHLLSVEEVVLELQEAGVH